MSIEIKPKPDANKLLHDIGKFIEEPSLPAVSAILEYCISNNCAEYVPGSSKIELVQIRDRFAQDYLGLGPAAGEAGINKVCYAMRDAYPVRRVTFLYLLAEYTDSIEWLEQPSD